MFIRGGNGRCTATDGSLTLEVERSPFSMTIQAGGGQVMAFGSDEANEFVDFLVGDQLAATNSIRVSIDKLGGIADRLVVAAEQCALDETSFRKVRGCEPGHYELLLDRIADVVADALADETNSRDFRQSVAMGEIKAAVSDTLTDIAGDVQNNVNALTHLITTRLQDF
jgi:hypothetical protein